MKIRGHLAYESLAGRRQAGVVCERAADAYGFAYTERHLQCVWFDPSLRPPALHTDEGEPVAVESPGRWNLEAGPDFLDAVLRLGSGERRLAGDVEIHVHPSDWASHAHGADPRYARVVAHVSYFPAAVQAAGRRPAAVGIALKHALAANPAFSFENIDVSAYPYARRTADAPCARVLAAWPTDDVLQLLDAAGEARLVRKAGRARAAAAGQGRAAALYEEIMCALGYKQNKAAFRLLAARAPLDRLRAACGGDALRACAILLGLAGLLPAEGAARWDAETKGFVRALWDAWWKEESAWRRRAMDSALWVTSGFRPQNHPLRRIFAAACIFARPSAALDGPAPAGRAFAAWLARARRALLDIPADAYWTRRLSLGGRVQRAPVALVGESLADIIAANVLVPFAIADGVPAAEAAAALQRPSWDTQNAATREAAFRLLGPDHSPAWLRPALRQQGLLQVFHDFCLHDRSACASCPFPAALSARGAAGSAADAG